MTKMINERRFHEEDFPDFLKQLIQLKMIEGKAAGIAAKVIDDGIDSLSEKQRYVFNKEIIEHYYVERCERDDIEIPWCEMLEALDNGGLCAWCDHMVEKAMAE